ncbi:hypothetical protein M8J75_007732 [Diaphorina citri]|nr:hypothetical protein M8J75_007732 [Diaphorina citri]
MRDATLSLLISGPKMSPIRRNLKLSCKEKFLLATMTAFQAILLVHFLVKAIVRRKWNAATLQNEINLLGACVSTLAFIKNYVPIHNGFEEVRQMDKLFQLIRPDVKHRDKLSYTEVRTWYHSSLYILILISYWSLHCEERFCGSGKARTLPNLFRLCVYKLLVISEFTFVLYWFVDFTLVLKRRLKLLNQMIGSRLSDATQRATLYRTVHIADHDVSSVLVAYTKLYDIQRRSLLCFRIPILVFYSDNVYSLTFVILTSYNQYFYKGSCTGLYPSMWEFLFRSAICYGVILACVLCCREADQISVNMQRCTSIGSNVKFFLLELRDRKFKFEIFRLFSLDFDTFLSKRASILCFKLRFNQLNQL